MIRRCPRLIRHVFPGIVLVALMFTSRVAIAGRGIPDPLLIQFAGGYGVVAAQLLTITPVEGEDGGHSYSLAFEVEQIMAQPVEGGPFPLRRGDRLTLRLNVGYAATIEGEPKGGDRYYLTIRQLGGNAYEHADGASAVKKIEHVTASEADFYARVRKLAAAPAAQRLGDWLSALKDRHESEAVRLEVSTAIDRQLWLEQFPRAKLEQVCGSVMDIWKDDADPRSYRLAESLDRILVNCDPLFAKSSERLNGWTRQLFAPTPTNMKDDNDRDNFAQQELVELIAQYPTQLGRRAIEEMSNRKWPPAFRRSIASALLQSYLDALQPEPGWDQALAEYYAKALDEADPWVTRMLAADLKSGARYAGAPNGELRRRFIPGPTVREALRGAHLRMKEIASRPGGDANAPTAVKDLENAMEALDRPNSPQPNDGN